MKDHFVKPPSPLLISIWFSSLLGSYLLRHSNYLMLHFLTISIIFWGKYEAFFSFLQNILWYKIIFFKAFASEKWWKDSVSLANVLR